MKEEWKVFIRGVEGRGDEVKQALINLGGKVINNYSYGALDSLFFIDHYGEIRYAAETSEIAKIIRDNYREIKLPEKWKDGDILINNDGTCYKIFSECDPHNANLFYAYNVSISVIDGKITHYPDVAWSCYRKKYSIATPSQIERFYELLHASNKDWDANKKQLVDWEWKPKKGEDYWTIIVGITIYKLKLTWAGSEADKIRYELGNCFRTCNKADDMLNTIKLLFNKE